MYKPKIIFFDIESIGVNAMRADLGRVVMFGYKTNRMRKAKVIKMTREELRHFDDKPLLIKLSKVYEEADLSVAHYGAPFDRRFIQGRLLINHLPPIPPTKMRDTCLITRSIANFSSNRLGHLNHIMGLKHQKMDKGNGWPEWWFKVMQGNMQAVRNMAAYCAKDVLAVEDLYYHIRPFDNAHPVIYFDKKVCIKCGSKKVQSRGISMVGLNKYPRYQCMGCGTWGRGRKAIK